MRREATHNCILSVPIRSSLYRLRLKLPSSVFLALMGTSRPTDTAPGQVPTWNYAAVHLHGTLSLALPADLHPMLRRLSAAFESRLAPKTGMGGRQNGLRRDKKEDARHSALPDGS